VGRNRSTSAADFDLFAALQLITFFSLFNSGERDKPWALINTTVQAKHDTPFHIVYGDGIIPRPSKTPGTVHTLRSDQGFRLPEMLTHLRVSSPRQRRGKNCSRGRHLTTAYALIISEQRLGRLSTENSLQCVVGWSHSIKRGPCPQSPPGNGTVQRHDYRTHYSPRSSLTIRAR
jgi:hypothetical protein